MIISLTKSGSLDYAMEICKKLTFTDKQCLFSSGAKRPVIPESHLIDTYEEGYLSFLFRSILFLFKSPFLVRHYKSSGKITHFYFTVFHPWNLILTVWARCFGIKIILSVHDYTTHDGEQSSMIELIQKLNIRLADHVIFLSQAERQKAIHDSEKVRPKSSIIGHPLLAVDLTNQQQHSEDLKVLFLGRILPYKGVDDLIRVCEAHNIKLTVAGKGLLQRKNYKEHIVIKNQHIDKHELDEYLATHHVLVLPYREASQSGILSLGVSAGIPMIIRKTGGLTEQIDADAALWVEDNEKSLEEALLKIKHSAASYNQMKDKIMAFRDRFEAEWQIEFKNTISDIIGQC